MNLFALLASCRAEPHALPEFIREMQDIRGVRIVRLQGAVGKDIGAEVEAVNETAQHDGGFNHPVLFDFAGVTDFDSTTLGYLIQSLRRRMATHTHVGILNPSPQLLVALEMARIQDLFRVFTSEDEALSSLSPETPTP